MCVVSRRKGPTCAKVFCRPNWLQCLRSVRSSVRGVWSSRFEMSIAQRYCLIAEPLEELANQKKWMGLKAGTSSRMYRDGSKL